MVRAHVAWALGRIASPTALDGLRARLSREGDGSVREEIMLAVNAFGESGP
jgi:HEAT repeat protein